MKKQEAIVEVGESINQAVCEIMRLPGGSDVSVIYRAMMDSAQVELMDLGAFCEAEMIRASQAGAHFSSCLMGAAMNEAFLALMCLLFEHEVRETRQFHYSTRKLSDVDYRQVVANWSLEQFICIAEECNWIPANIVERGIVAALADGFRELMPMTNPGLSDGEIERGAMAFFAAPGSSMLRMTQSLRNAIHAGSWMRRRSTFNADAFEGWCKFAAVLCGEIRLCLMHQFMTRLGSVASMQLTKVKAMLDSLPAELIPLIEAEMRRKLGSPSFAIGDVDKFVSVMVAASLNVGPTAD